MLKTIFMASFFLIIFAGCQKSNFIEPFNYERDTPAWLKQKIDYMSANQMYYGAKVYRYEWNKEFVYHIVVPISSCAYCEVYDQEGNKITFVNDSMFQGFIENKKNETLIWEWRSREEK